MFHSGSRKLRHLNKKQNLQSVSRENCHCSDIKPAEFNQTLKENREQMEDTDQVSCQSQIKDAAACHQMSKHWTFTGKAGGRHINYAKMHVVQLRESSSV